MSEYIVPEQPLIDPALNMPEDFQLTCFWGAPLMIAYSNFSDHYGIFMRKDNGVPSSVHRCPDDDSAGLYDYRHKTWFRGPILIRDAPSVSRSFNFSVALSEEYVSCPARLDHPPCSRARAVQGG